MRHRAAAAPVVLLAAVVGAAVSMSAAEAPQAAGPGAGGMPQLRMTGGVGYRQFLRVTQWLAGNLATDRDAPRIWLSFHQTGRGFRDSVLELADGKAELALVNGRSVGAMAVAGRGLFSRPIAGLRAIAALPHYDWALFGVDAALGVRSFAELREKKAPLKLATGYLDGDSAVGFICVEVLRRHGITPDDLKRWGGGLVPGGPSDNRNDVLAGRANAVCQEGARGEEWEDLARKKPLHFLSIEPAVATALAGEVAFPTLTVTAGYYPGQPDSFVATDFSDWLICVRSDMSDAMAHRLAQIVVEQRAQLDREYGAEPPRYSSINVPLDPGKLVKTAPVPLHPGAARYYTGQGLH